MIFIWVRIWVINSLFWFLFLDYLFLSLNFLARTFYLGQFIFLIFKNSFFLIFSLNINLFFIEDLLLLKFTINSLTLKIILVFHFVSLWFNFLNNFLAQILFLLIYLFSNFHLLMITIILFLFHFNFI